MKIALASDLHLEFGDINLKNEQNADVLILSGDICVAEDLHDHPEPMTPYTPEVLKILGSRQRNAQLYRDFLKRCSFQFPNVIYIAGNHEFYQGKFYGNLNDLRNECRKFTNVHFMEDDVLTIGEFTFIGCTLWTNMNKFNPITMHVVTNGMNDFRIIRNDKLGYVKLRPAHVYERHVNSMEFLKKNIERNYDKKFVVVGHHAPTMLSIHENYAKDFHMNGAYASDLSNFILDNPQIKLWTHGHTHHPFDYMIGSTRVLCNPRGYVGYEDCADNFELKYLDI